MQNSMLRSEGGPGHHQSLHFTKSSTEIPGYIFHTLKISLAIYLNSLLQGPLAVQQQNTVQPSSLPLDNQIAFHPHFSFPSEILPGAPLFIFQQHSVHDMCIPYGFSMVIKAFSTPLLVFFLSLPQKRRTVSSGQSRLFFLLLCISKFFQHVDIMQFQSCFHIFKYLLQQHPSSQYQNLH